MYKGRTKSETLERRLKTVTPLDRLLRMAEDRPMVRSFYQNAIWEEGKGVYRDGMVDKDSFGGFKG